MTREYALELICKAIKKISKDKDPSMIVSRNICNNQLGRERSMYANSNWLLDLIAGLQHESWNNSVDYQATKGTFERYISNPARITHGSTERAKMEDKYGIGSTNKIINQLSTRGASEILSEIKRIQYLPPPDLKDQEEAYFHTVFYTSNYPRWFTREASIKYVPDSRQLIAEVMLPSLEDIPNFKAFKRGQGRRISYKAVPAGERERKSALEVASYQIALRFIAEAFIADHKRVIDNIVFNGISCSPDPATGRRHPKTLLSIQVTKEEFQEIDITSVDAKSCFRHLRGISAASLATLTPINPITTISWSDSRIIQESHIIENVPDGLNLAQMDWQDFEHLVREIFEREFSSGGGEVKVTRASRDGGVDAIAFDPDPIRGGKFIIQAKRYNAIVPVSAVRDLYGTVMNEGAIKGILVTTSYYGNDSHEFAKGKPITLLDGSNLLHLFQKHGYAATISLRK